MEDFGEIFTLVVTLAVAVLGFVLKARDTKAKKAMRENAAGNPVEHKPEEERRTVSAGTAAARPASPNHFEEGQRMFESSTFSESGVEEQPKKKEKFTIDKKKLIIYSEIMKPKYDE